MLRALRPWILVSAIVVVAGSMAYSRGAPLWVVYVTLLVCLAIMLHGEEHWERRRR